MADQLATTGDLSTFLGETIAAATETFLLEVATAAVQDAAGQRLVEVTDDTVELLGTADYWLQLPEKPVASVSSVEIDGDAVTDFELRGSRLWRDHGWREPANFSPLTSTPPTSVVAVTYSHGYELTDQDVQFARQVTLVTAAQMYANPLGATGLSIDDFRQQFSQSAGTSAGGEIPERLQRALRRKYGLRTGELAAT